MKRIITFLALVLFTLNLSAKKKEKGIWQIEIGTGVNANYHWTYVSFISLLYGDFPVTEKSKRYKNRDNLFSYNMLEKKNFFYQIINKLNMNFFWIGNEYEPCKGSKDGECFYNYSDYRWFFLFY